MLLLSLSYPLYYIINVSRFNATEDAAYHFKREFLYEK